MIKISIFKIFAENNHLLHHIVILFIQDNPIKRIKFESKQTTSNLMYLILKAKRIKHLFILI